MTDLAYKMDAATDPTTVNSTGTAAAAITSTPAGFAVTATSSGAGADMRLAGSATYKHGTGLTALKITTASGVTNIIRLPFAAGGRQVAVEFYHGSDALPTSALCIATIQTAADSGPRIVLNTDGSISLQDASGVTQGTTAAGVWAAGRRNRIAVLLDNSGGAAAGSGSLRVFNDDSTTATGTTGVLSAKNFAAANLTKVDLGSPTSTGIVFVEWFDDVQMGDARTTEFGPLSTNIAPTVSLGGNFTVDPNLVDSFVLTATAADSDGTIASYLFEDITGTATTIVGTGSTRTVSVPRSVTGATRVYRVTVTDNLGATATSTVTVTVLPHTRWAKLASGLKAVRRYIVPAVSTFTNLAADGAATSVDNTGLGRYGNDRFGANVTVSAVANAADGPLMPSSNKRIRTYSLENVITGRTKLGWQHADNPEATSGTRAKQIPVTAGLAYRFSEWVWCDSAHTFSGFTRGSSSAGWVDALASLSSVSVPANTWTLLTGVYTVPATVDRVAYGAWFTDTVPTGGNIKGTGLIVTQESTYVEFPVPAETTPSNVPAGYALFKEIDLTSMANWEVREGQTKASGIMRAANVTITPQGLNLAAGRIGGEVSSSEVRLNGDPSLAAPNFCFLRTEITFDAIVGGIWPAVWRRPFPGYYNGEIDDMEKFGTTTHGGLHTTDHTQSGEYDAPGHRQRPGANFSGTAGGAHVVESLLTATAYTEWWDGVLVGTITPSDYNANATPVNTATLWTPQFDTATKKWQLIFSNQVNAAYGGGLPSGAYVWNLVVTRCRIWAPA